jgi:hypothetical protein
MHAAQGPFSRVKGNVALNERGLETVVFEFAPAPGPRKETPLIPDGPDRNLKNSRYYSFTESHGEYEAGTALLFRT